MYVLRSVCRSCEGSDLEIVLSLGEMPLPDALLLPSQLADPERRYPLDVTFCRDCSLVQLMQTVSPGEICDERYRYLSSSSPATAAHAQALAERLVAERGLDGNSYVIEIGSNDGYLLKHLQARGVATLGIEPAPVAVAEARRSGIATLGNFFTRELANQLAIEGPAADVIIASGVLSQVPDLHGFLAGVRRLLADTGVAIIEVPYVRDLVQGGEFDSIDHERLCYFSVTSLVRLIESAHLCLNHVEHYPVHGGILRLFLSHSQKSQPSVQEFLDAETRQGLQTSNFYAKLPRRAELIKSRLLMLLADIKSRRKSIVGYGAAGRGSTMVNYCGLGERYLDYIVDANVQMQGRFVPGVHLPILNPARLGSNRPDYVLLLAGEGQEDILREHTAYRSQGGRFIVPIPEPAII